MDFPFHDDNLKVKDEMTEEPVQNWKTAYLKANIDHMVISNVKEMWEGNG